RRGNSMVIPHFIAAPPPFGPFSSTNPIRAATGSGRCPSNIAVIFFVISVRSAERELSPAISNVIGDLLLESLHPPPSHFPQSQNLEQGQCRRHSGCWLTTRYPPAIAPRTISGSAPVLTASGSGASGDSWDRSSSQAKTLRNARLFCVTWSRIVPRSIG